MRSLTCCSRRQYSSIQTWQMSFRVLPLYSRGFSGRLPTALNRSGKVSRCDCEPAHLSPWSWPCLKVESTVALQLLGGAPVSEFFLCKTHFSGIIVGHLVSDQPWCQAALIPRALSLCHWERVSLRVNGGLLSWAGTHHNVQNGKIYFIRSQCEKPPSLLSETLTKTNPSRLKKKRKGKWGWWPLQRGKVFDGVSSSLTAVEKMVLAIW